MFCFCYPYVVVVVVVTVIYVGYFCVATFRVRARKCVHTFSKIRIIDDISFFSDKILVCDVIQHVTD